MAEVSVQTNKVLERWWVRNIELAQCVLLWGKKADFDPGEYGRESIFVLVATWVEAPEQNDEGSRFTRFGHMALASDHTPNCSFWRYLFLSYAHWCLAYVFCICVRVSGSLDL